MRKVPFATSKSVWNWVSQFSEYLRLKITDWLEILRMHFYVFCTHKYKSKIELSWLSKYIFDLHPHAFEWCLPWILPDVNIHDLVILSQVWGLNAAHSQDASAVNQDIQPAKAANGLFHSLPHCVFISQVSRNKQRL